MWSTRLFTFITLLSGLDVSCEGNRYSKRNTDRISYPPARCDMYVVDYYHGTEVDDPYRCLEDPDSNDTKSFIHAQNVISDSYFNSSSVMNKITEKLTQLKNYSRQGCPGRAGHKYYYFYNSGLQNQAVLYVKDTLTSEPSVLVDPNGLSEDGTISLGGTQAFSPDGSYFAYSLRVGGSDWVTIKVKDVSNGKDLPDTLDNVDYSVVAWTSDNQGFFYSAPNTPLTEVFVNHSVFYHHLNTNKTEDLLAFHIPGNHHFATDSLARVFKELFQRSFQEGHVPRLWRSSTIIPVPKKKAVSQLNDYRLVALTSVPMKCAEKTVFKHLRRETEDHQGPLQFAFTRAPENHTCLAENLDNYNQYVTNEAEVFYIITNKDAPYKELVQVNISDPASENWVSIVAENGTRGLLLEAQPSGDKLVLHYLNAARSELYIHNLQTGAEEHKVDVEIGSIDCISGKATDAELFFKVTSFLSPGIIYSLNVNSRVKTVLHQSTVSGFEPDNFETKQLYYTSYDGTTVPMFVVQKKSLALSGDHPVLLHGYGGFSISIMPSFRFEVSLFLQHFGGVFAVANIRGGAEYGEDWHKGGMLGNKQNVFDDFQAAAEYLINNNYTNTDKIAINGRSNGGLLVGACLNQRPDLFAAGIIEVGVLDMLRFPEFTGGMYWIPEYGSPDNATQFQWLFRYSPLHNIPEDTTKGQYPATLVMTADKDDRVVPLHSLKFIAQLQHSLGIFTDQTNPLLLRVETDAGHGAGTSTSKIIAQKAAIFSFLSRSMSLVWND